MISKLLCVIQLCVVLLALNLLIGYASPIQAQNNTNMSDESCGPIWIEFITGPVRYDGKISPLHVKGYEYSGLSVKISSDGTFLFTQIIIMDASPDTLYDVEMAFCRLSDTDAARAQKLSCHLLNSCHAVGPDPVIGPGLYININGIDKSYFPNSREMNNISSSLYFLLDENSPIDYEIN